MLAFVDALAILASYLIALLLRFDFVFGNIDAQYLDGYVWSMPFWVIATIVVFYIFRLYHSIWRFASVTELWQCISAYMVLLPVYAIGMLVMQLSMPRSYYFMGYLISMCGTIGIRFSYRLLRMLANRGKENSAEDRVMIIGAGSAGQTLIKEMINSNQLNTKVCCIIDDNSNKKGRMLEGIPIVGDRYDIEEMVEEYHINHIIYAIPATTGENRKAILNICKNTNCRLQTLPGVYQLVNGEVSVSKLRNVEIVDLLGR